MTSGLTTVRSDQTGEQRFSLRELCCAGLYALVLIWVNAYICREMFFNEAAHMNSMQGF